MNRLVALLLAGLWALTALPGQADPLFESDSVLRVSLHAPLAEIADDDAADADYRDGRFRYRSADGTAVELDVKVKPRGGSRRDADVCAFPPLWLNFRKKQVAGTLFDGQDRLKLVTWCRSVSYYQQKILREYLAYRIFNVLTDLSFRVRLLEVDYVDSGRGDDTMTRLSFVIEHQDRLARRIDTPHREIEAIEADWLEPAHASLAELFEYMIGNVDYSLFQALPGEECCHNTKLFQRADGRYYSIPYDFDFTGLVDPPYGFGHPKLRQTSVRQRIFRGVCREGPYLQNAVERVRERRPAIFRLIEQQPGLNARNRRELADYIEEFYDTIDDPRRLARRITEACRYPD
jgi:hypothetical protein